MKKVIVFGTFDILHPGHESFLKQARKLGDYLLVAVARDVHVESAKGRKPRHSEKIRARRLQKSGLANKVILASRTHNFPSTLRNYKIDILALGYDQKPQIYELKRKLKKHRLSNLEIKRMRPLRPEIYKSSKLGYS